MKKILLTIVASLLFTTALYAQEYGMIYRGPRPMGMGGAFTAVSDDENAIFYNPAGLNRIKPGEGKISVLNPQVTMNTSAMNVVSKIKGMTTQNPIDALTPYIGQNMDVEVVTSMPYWVRHDFELALLLPSLQNDTLLRRNVATEAIENVVADSGLMVGVAHGFMQDRLSIGADVKFLVRGAGHANFDAVQLYTKQNVVVQGHTPVMALEWTGTLAHCTRSIRSPFFIPSVGLTINNIGATKFPTHFGSNKEILSDQFALKRSLGLGSKFELPSGRHFTSGYLLSTLIT